MENNVLGKVEQVRKATIKSKEEVEKKSTARQKNEADLSKTLEIEKWKIKIQNEMEIEHGQTRNRNFM